MTEPGADASAAPASPDPIADAPRARRSRPDATQPGTEPRERPKLSRADTVVEPGPVTGSEPGAPPAPTGARAAGGDGAPAVAPGAAAAVDLVAQALRAQASPVATATTSSATTGATPTVTATAAGVTSDPATAATRAADQGSGPPSDPYAELATTSGATRSRPTTARPAPAAGPRRSRFWRFGYPVIILAITLAIPLLAWAGKKVVFQSTDGKVLTEITDPAAPGWQALTDPTPTLLLVQTDAAGTPNGLTVMSLTGDGSGGLIFLPMTTVLDLPDIGKLPLNTVAEKTGQEGLQKAVEGILGAGMGDVRVVSPQQWADLVAPVGPLTFTNPDDVSVADENGTKKVIFPKGSLTLPPADVAAYLGTTSPGENDLNRLERQKVFWQAWLQKVGASTDPNVVPGEKDSGIGKFVRALGADRVEMFPLPVQGAGIPGTSATVYLPVKDQVSSLVARLVPFPIGAPPGARPRVRLLDGTGKLDHGLEAAPLVVEGGGQIDQIGNASSFSVPTTQLVYFDEAQRPAVELLRQTLGVGEIVKGGSAGSAVDVSITLGQDYLAQPQRELTPVTAAPAGAATTTIVGVNGG